MYIYTRGSGGMFPQDILVFRLSETASGAFSGTVSLVINPLGATGIYICT